MSPVIHTLVHLANAVVSMKKATSMLTNDSTKGIEKELCRFFMSHVNEFAGLVDIENKEILTDFEINLGMDKGKLYCIREYRARTGKTLMDSKQFVEDYFIKNNLLFYKSY